MDLVSQDLELSSDRLASDNPDNITNTKDITGDMTGDSSFNKAPAQTDSKAGLPPQAPLARPPEETALDQLLGRSTTDPALEVAVQVQIRMRSQIQSNHQMRLQT